MHHFLPFRVDQYWGAMVNPSIEKEKYLAGTVENSLVPLLYLSEDSEGGWHITKGEAVYMNGYWQLEYNKQQHQQHAIFIVMRIYMCHMYGILQALSTCMQLPHYDYMNHAAYICYANCYEHFVLYFCILAIPIACFETMHSIALSSWVCGKMHWAMWITSMLKNKMVCCFPFGICAGLCCDPYCQACFIIITTYLQEHAFLAFRSAWSVKVLAIPFWCMNVWCVATVNSTHQCLHPSLLSIQPNPVRFSLSLSLYKH